MAEKLMYICDKCSKEWEARSEEEQAVAIGLVIKFGHSHLNMSESIYSHVMWCRTCLMRTGLSLPYSNKDEKVAPEQPLSMEEKITMLLEELGFIRGE